MENVKRKERKQQGVAIRELGGKISSLQEAFLFAERCLEEKHSAYMNWATMLIYANRDQLTTNEEWIRLHELARKMQCALHPERSIAALAIAEEVMKRAKGTSLKTQRQKELDRAWEIKILTQETAATAR